LPENAAMACGGHGQEGRGRKKGRARKGEEERKTKDQTGRQIEVYVCMYIQCV
jgi:hypothetical protein